MILSPMDVIFGLLAVAALGVEAVALVDAIRRPTGAFVAVGKLTRPLWLIILGVSTLVGLGTAITAFQGAGIFALIGILPIAAFVAGAVYLTDVRPKVREFRRGTSHGPYGPW